NIGLVALLANSAPDVLRDSKRGGALIDWCDPEWPVYLNTLHCEDETELENALLVSRMIFEWAGSLESLTRGKGYLEAGLRMIANGNLAMHRERERIAEIVRRPVEDLRYGNPLFIEQLLDNQDYRHRLYPLSPPGLVGRMSKYDGKNAKEQEEIAKSLLDRVFTLRNNPHFAHTIGSSRSAMRWKE